MIDRKMLEKLYKKSKQRKLAKTLQEEPTQYRPIVTTKDVEAGYITRYFVRNINSIQLVYEVDKTTYDNFRKNPRFVVTKVSWKIVGKKYKTEREKNGTMLVDNGVYEYNIQAVSTADLTFGGLSNYIIDYLEFWIAEV